MKEQLLAMIGPWQLILLVFLFMAILLPIIALVDILRNEFTGSNKLIWVIVVLMLPMAGSILYFMFGAKQKLN